MAFNILIPGQYGQGLNLSFGDANGDGKFDFGLGVRNYGAYGNAYGGAYASNEIGFNTGRGVYMDQANGSWNAFGSQNNYYGVDSSGVQRGSSTYADVFGNYQNNRYANDVWGNYYGGQTSANRWGYSNSDVSGNAWTGQQSYGAQYGDAFGNYGNYGGYTPGYGYGGVQWGGGGNVYGWFG